MEETDLAVAAADQIASAEAGAVKEVRERAIAVAIAVATVAVAFAAHQERMRLESINVPTGRPCSAAG